MPAPTGASPVLPSAVLPQGEVGGRGEGEKGGGKTTASARTRHPPRRRREGREKKGGAGKPVTAPTPPPNRRSEGGAKGDRGGRRGFHDQVRTEPPRKRTARFCPRVGKNGSDHVDSIRNTKITRGFVQNLMTWIGWACGDSSTFKISSMQTEEKEILPWWHELLHLSSRAVMDVSTEKPGVVSAREVTVTRQYLSPLRRSS